MNEIEKNRVSIISIFLREQIEMMREGSNNNFPFPSRVEGFLDCCGK